MALVGNISGSNGQSRNAVTGSLVIADLSVNFPAIASDAVLFVSGNINGTSKTVIGGDLVSSGSILVKDSAGVANITLAPVGNITGSNALLTGDLAVNGGDIATTSAVLNISAGATGLAFLNGTSPFLLVQSSSYNSMPGVTASTNVGKLFAASGKDLLLGPGESKAVFITGSFVNVNAASDGFQIQRDGTELLRIISGSGNGLLSVVAGPNMLTASVLTTNVRTISFGSSTSTGSFGGDFAVSGRTGLGGVAEVMSHFQGGNTIICDMIGQSIFYLNSPSNDVTANFTNVPTGNNRVHTPTVILSQSSTPRIVSVVQVDGVNQTINWANNVTPAGNLGKQDVFGFSLIRSGSAWKVLGQMSTYG